jgi:hypothetical protein
MKKFVFLLALLCFSAAGAASQETADPSDKPYIVENYYRIKWGYQDAFIELYKKNHYPIVKRMMDLRYITEFYAEKSPFHTPEADRWDFRIRLVFKNLEAAFAEDAWEEASKALFPDQEKLKEEEQKRFELLIAHWDILLTPVDLDNWQP